MAKTKMNKFSLSSYTFMIILPTYEGDTKGSAIKVPGEGNNSGLPLIEIGGEGDYLGVATIARRTDLWDVEADATGAYVMNQNLDKTGTCRLDIKQVSDTVLKLLYYTTTIFEDPNLNGGARITIQKNGTPIYICEDCVIRKMPDYEVGKTAKDLQWEFICGKVAPTADFVEISTDLVEEE